jgi:hypothetical protein
MNTRRIKIIAAAVAASIAALIAANSTPDAGADESFAVCPSGHSGIATSVTSCPFAENVRIGYLTQGGPIVLAYSPVTGANYLMQCAPGFLAHLNTGYTVPSVRCVGGNNAVVVVW